MLMEGKDMGATPLSFSTGSAAELLSVLGRFWATVPEL